MTAQGPSTRGADGGADRTSTTDARRELDEIMEIVDELYALEDALQARVAPRLGAIKNELAGVLEDVVRQRADPQREEEHVESELSYLDPEEHVGRPEQAPHGEPVKEAEHGARPGPRGQSFFALSVCVIKFARRSFYR